MSIALARRGVLQKPGSAAFSPDQIAGLVGWFKADATLYQDSARTTPATADGDPVGSWTDSSTAANHASQATGAARPTLKTGANGINSKPVVRFDAIDDILNSSMSAATKPFSLIAVVKPTNLSAFRTIVGASAGDAAHFRMDQTTGKLTLNKQNTAGIGTSTGGLTAGAAAIAAVTYSATGAYVFYRDGAADGSGTNNQTFVARTSLIGFRDASAEPWLGDMAEIIKYDSVLSAGDMQSVEDYLGSKYGITVT